MRLLPRPGSASSARPSSPHHRPPAVIPGRAPAWQRRFLRHRRLIAALLAGFIVWSLGTTLRPAAPETTLVVTARHDLAPGSTLTDADMDLVARPVAALAPDWVDDPHTIAGRVVAFPVHTGEAVRARDVVGRSLLDSLGAGIVATPVRLSDDATLASVRPGDVVDVVAARGGDGSTAAAAVVVAARVRVLTVGSPAASASTGLLGASSSAPAPVLLLATTSAQALDVAAAAVGSRLSVILHAA